MDVDTAIRQRRTIRRFQDKPVEPAILRELVDLARLHASGGNLQPLRYAIVSKQPLVKEMFACFGWAMYLPDFVIPDDRRPQAYILLLSDVKARRECPFDAGAAATTIMLAAEARGLATCCLGSAKLERLYGMLGLPEDMALQTAIALGYPAQASEAVPYEGSVRYYETADGDIRVPKLSLEEVLVFEDRES